MIDPKFKNIYRLFVLSFKNGDNDPKSRYFDKYYMPLVEIKNFNVLIDNKPFFDHPVKSRQEVSEKRIEMSRNDYNITGNLLDFLHLENYYKFIGIDLLRQTSKNIPHQINFLGKLDSKFL